MGSNPGLVNKARAGRIDKKSKQLHQDWRVVCGVVFEILRLNKKNSTEFV